MKNIGIVKRLDNLGRIVIPKEMRSCIGVASGELMEIFTDGELITLKKYNPGCSFCGDMQVIKEIGEKRLCKACLAQLQAGL